MCSVNLVLLDKKSAPDSPHSLIKEMTGITAHRGPDNTNFYLTENLAIGFNRLQIVGKKNGQQPITSEDNSLVLVCNGEIFNHLELKEKYFKDKKFRTTSDVEIILHLYKKYGIRSLKLLEGQFSLILYDKIKEKIYCSRDQFGILPLYYSISNKHFIVSSEIKAILKTGLISNPALNEKAFIQTWMFYGPIPPNTLFKNILQLPSSHYLEYSIKTKQIKIVKYKTQPEKKYLQAHSLSATLRESVASRLQGDYTPGVYISGGIDSAIIAFFVNSLSIKKPVLFGITFQNKDYDESYFQNLLAKYLKCKFYSINITPGDIISGLEKCIFHTESPLIRSSPVPMMLLSQKVRAQKIKFVLCGEGSDELFLGYPVFAKGLSSFEEKYEKNIQFLTYFKNKKIKKQVEMDYRQLSEDSSINENHKRIRLNEIKTKLTQFLLSTQGDRVSMANSVEQRFPYLNNKIYKLALGLKRDQLIDSNGGKRILYKNFKGIVPEEIFNRKKKGYLAPDVDVSWKLLAQKGKYFNKKDMVDSSIFDVKKVNELTNRIKVDKSIREEEARLLLFITTTSMLFKQFIKPGNMIKYYDQ